MNRRVRIPSLLLFLVLWVSALMSAEIASAAPAIALDQEAQTALNALYAQSPGAKALGDKAKAAASYNRAIDIRPKDEAARSGIARVGG